MDPKRRPPMHPVPALPFTNHTANFTGVIDYIWYTVDDFEVDGVLGGYFLESNLGRDIIRWIREGQHAENVPTAPNTPVSASSLHTDSLLVYQPQSPTQMMHPSLQFQHAGINAWSLRGTRTIGFPNPVFPSDHIPVMCEISWRPPPVAGEKKTGRDKNESTSPAADGKRQRKQSGGNGSNVQTPRTPGVRKR
jgi:hypothetical protein